MKIPEYQADKLASSLVGTPGQDQSGQMIGNAVTKAAGQVEDAALTIAKQRNDARVLAAANKASIDLDVVFDDVDRSHKEKFANSRISPQESNAAYRAALEERFNTSLEAIPDEQTRAHVAKYGYSALHQRLKSESTRADMQQAAFAFSDAEAATSLLGRRAAEVALSTDDEQGKALALQALLNRGSTTHQVASKIVSPENSAKLQKVIPSTIAKGYLDALVDSDPLAIEDGLKRVGQFLDADEIDKYKTDAKKSFELQKEKKDTERLMSVLSENDDLYKKYMDGSLRYGDTRGMADQRAAKTLDNLRLKANTVNPETSFNREMAFNDQIFALISKEGTKDAAVRKSATVESVLKLQNEILDSVNDTITPAQAESLLNRLRIPAARGVEKADLKKLSAPFRAAYRYITTEGKKAKLHASVQAGMLGHFERRMEKLGPEPTGEQMSDAVKQAWFDEIYDHNPNYGKYELKDTVSVNGVPYYVAGYYPDGEPDFRPVEKTK